MGVEGGEGDYRNLNVSVEKIITEQQQIATFFKNDVKN